MGNPYGLREEDIDKVRARDKVCVYCHKQMFKPSKEVWRGDWATIEHLNHLPPWDNPNTIAICCSSCNSSRGNKTILNWFNSKFCHDKGINPQAVAAPVLAYIREYEGYGD